MYSTHGACPECDFVPQGELEPRHFSFNTHVGACEECDGLGEHLSCDIELLVTHPELPLDDGALHGKLGRYLAKGKGYYEGLLRAVAKAHKIDLGKPWEKLTGPERELLATGKGARASYHVKLERSTENAEIAEEFRAAWPGLCGHVDAWHKKTEDPEWASILEQVMLRRTCSACGGRAPARRVRAP